MPPRSADRQYRPVPEVSNRRRGLSWTVADLITLIVGIALATEHYPEPASAADRLFRLAVAGLTPQS
ncbi:hypothetical protein [Amycolatopsis sp. cmx-11-51]|uniref:hypothetical protein n=1 Tax=unclassified Amycolatopsis TaxID=2618356 RepID=UPI0039E68FD5